MDKIPLSLGEVPPSAEAEKLLLGEHPYFPGASEGLHTGGVWLWRGEVWKPLDAKPYANATHRVPTLEAVVLHEMAGKPLFPRNWRVETANDRRWLVRPKSLIVERLGTRKRRYDAVYYEDMAEEQPEIVLAVEEAVYALNRAGWEIGDPITLGVDPDGQWFIVDMSTAVRVGRLANEWWRVRQFFALVGANWLLALRENSMNVIHSVLLGEYEKPDDVSYCYVYASFARPISRMWATNLPETALLIQQTADWSTATPHTFVVTEKSLADEVVRSYELMFGWRRLRCS